MRSSRDVKRKRWSPAFLLSLAVHVIAAVALMRILVIPRLELFGKKNGNVAVARIGFLKLAKSVGKEPTPGRNGGNGIAASKTPAVKLVAPTNIPTSLPPVAPSRVTQRDEGTGPLVGTGGPARGIKPVFSDPRLWGPPGKIVSAPKTLKQDLDSIIATALGPTQDSIGAAAGRRDPTDWTIGSGNHKWGIDQRAIRLGPFSIPTALLAMLPLNVQGNPTTMARDRAMNYMHRDISEHAQQAIDQADFNKAVRSIRERKERERAAAPGVDSGGR